RPRDSAAPGPPNPRPEHPKGVRSGSHSLPQHRELGRALHRMRLPDVLSNVLILPTAPRWTLPPVHLRNLPLLFSENVDGLFRLRRIQKLEQALGAGKCHATARRNKPAARNPWLAGMGRQFSG